MLKVYIVDDEPWVVSLIENVIPWKDHGFMLIGRGFDGRTALREIRYLKPAIVLTDIRMPDMSGLEMISALEDDPDPPEFVILSGHSEFEYARQALKSRVFDYLLKPVDEEELLKVLEKLKRRLGEREKNRAEAEQNHRKIRTLARMLMEEDKEDPVPKELERDRIRKAIYVMEREYASDLSLGEIASRVYLSESYFSDCFSKETGRTFKEYLTDIRIEKARELLAKPGLKVKDVAGLTGYSNPNYFCKVFKKKTGMNPREFARKKDS